MKLETNLIKTFPLHFRNEMGKMFLHVLFNKTTMEPENK